MSEANASMCLRATSTRTISPTAFCIGEVKAPTSPLPTFSRKTFCVTAVPQRDEADVWTGKGAEWTDGYLHVVATGSNDSGVSWIVEVEGRRIFHAGDLNNWCACFLASETPDALIRSTEFGIDFNPLAEEKRYLGELKDIRRALINLESGADIAPSSLGSAGGKADFDLVMFPIDDRIGRLAPRDAGQNKNGYTRGARQFVKQFSVRHFVPMHFAAAGFESAWRMAEYVQPPARFWRVSQEGETYII